MEIDNTTLPLAFPLWPDAITIQLSLADADQAQPVSVETSTVSRPPAAPMLSPDRLSENRHGAPAWLSWTVCDDTTMAPERGDGTGFAATLNGIAASPCPDFEPEIDTQLASVAIAHVQSRSVATFSVPDPPVAVNDDVELVTAT